MDLILKASPYLCGFVLAVPLGGYLVGMVVNALWRGVGWKDNTDSKFRFNTWLPRMVGLTERTLYLSSLLVGKGEFIGLWLALKVAGQWKQWNEEAEVAERPLHGRAVYQIFLIGNAFSILYSLVGFKLIEWLQSTQYLKACSVPLILVAATICAIAWSSRMRRAKGVMR